MLRELRIALHYRSWGQNQKSPHEPLMGAMRNPLPRFIEISQALQGGNKVFRSGRVGSSTTPKWSVIRPKPLRGASGYSLPTSRWSALSWCLRLPSPHSIAGSFVALTPSGRSFALLTRQPTVVRRHRLLILCGRAKGRRLVSLTFPPPPLRSGLRSLPLYSGFWLWLWFPAVTSTTPATPLPWALIPLRFTPCLLTAGLWPLPATARHLC